MMQIPLVDLKANYTAHRAQIDAAIARVLDNTSFIGGPEVRGFEQAYAEFQGTRRAVGIASGTAALYLALRALGVGVGDEVITTPHTFIATVEPIAQLGARPVFVDIDPETFNIDARRIEASITSHTKAIVPVHLYGRMAPMPEIMEIAHRHGLSVVEDAAQAHGAEIGGRRAGAWGNAACFSFFPSKNLGAYGDGGALCTNDEVLADTVAKLRDHGRITKYEHDVLGYGERLDALHAAILGAKLPYLNEWNAARRRHAAYYDEALSELDNVVTPSAPRDGLHVYHLYVVRVTGNRDAILGSLQQQGIGAGIHYPVPLHLQPALAGNGGQPGDYPHTEEAARSIISLPIFPELTEAQCEQVIKAFSHALKAG